MPVSTTQQTAIKMDFQRKEAIKFMDEHPLEFAPIPYTFETTTKAFAASACQKASAIGTLWAKNIQQNSSANTDCSQQRLFNEMNQF